MIKLVIFDLDGVLAKTEHIHDDALRTSIASVLGWVEFEDIIGLQGTTTKHKLQKLKERFNLTDEELTVIDLNKQMDVLWKIERSVVPEINQHKMLKKLSKNYILGIGSNARRENVDAITSKLGIAKYFFKILANNDVIHPKPDPEIYLTIIAAAGVSPDETLILEDSIAGKKAATDSGAYVFPVNDISEVTLENIENAIQQINANNYCPDGRDGK
jgi:beta-phosphoglucomutase